MTWMSLVRLRLYAFNQRTYAITENEAESYLLSDKINIIGFVFWLAEHKVLMTRLQGVFFFFLKNILKDINEKLANIMAINSCSEFH